MPKKFTHPRGTKKRLLLEQKSLGKTVPEARKTLKENGFNINLTYAYDVYKNADKPITPPTTPTTEPETATTEPADDRTEKPIEIPELTATTDALPPELQKLKDSIDAGTFTHENLVSLFEIINDYFNTFGYQKYRPPKTSSELLASAWVKVLNEKIKQMGQDDANIPIYAAVAITLIVYFPRLGLIIADKIKEKKTKKDDKLKKGLEAEEQLDKS